jgi:hypothetical protein
LLLVAKVGDGVGHTRRGGDHFVVPAAAKCASSGWVTG